MILKNGRLEYHLEVAGTRATMAPGRQGRAGAL